MTIGREGARSACHARVAVKALSTSAGYFARPHQGVEAAALWVCKGVAKEAEPD